MTTKQAKAETTGSICKILVNPGDAEDLEDVVTILESMKMEIPVSAPHAGRVVEVCHPRGRRQLNGAHAHVMEG